MYGELNTAVCLEKFLNIETFFGCGIKLKIHLFGQCNFKVITIMRNKEIPTLHTFGTK